MDSSHFLKRDELFTVVCRPALPMDKPGVLDLTRTIWGGGDYVPSVWDEWLADPEGLLAVAEYGGQVVGLVKLSRLSPTEWWLQGLRVRPERQGQGIASHLFDYAYDFWQRTAGGTLRLATASFRKPVHHLCERNGFRKVGEFSIFSKELLEDAERTIDPVLFTPLDAVAVPAALALVRRSPASPLSSGLMDLGWEWAEPSKYFLSKKAEEGWSWWWRGGEGLLLGYEDNEGSQKQFSISFIACPVERLAGCLWDCASLAAAQGHSHLRWIAPLDPEILSALQAAGFERQWDDSLFLYEKRMD